MALASGFMTLILLDHSAQFPLFQCSSMQKSLPTLRLGKNSLLGGSGSCPRGRWSCQVTSAAVFLHHASLCPATTHHSVWGARRCCRARYSCDGGDSYMKVSPNGDWDRLPSSLLFHSSFASNSRMQRFYCVTSKQAMEQSPSSESNSTSTRPVKTIGIFPMQKKEKERQKIHSFLLFVLLWIAIIPCTMYNFSSCHHFSLVVCIPHNMWRLSTSTLQDVKVSWIDSCCGYTLE